MTTPKPYSEVNTNEKTKVCDEHGSLGYSSYFVLGVLLAGIVWPLAVYVHVGPGRTEPYHTAMITAGIRGGLALFAVGAVTSIIAHLIWDTGGKWHNKYLLTPFVCGILLGGPTAGCFIAISSVNSVGWRAGALILWVVLGIPCFVMLVIMPFQRPLERRKEAEKTLGRTSKAAGLTVATNAKPTHGPRAGEVWFATPPIIGDEGSDMKERPCIVLKTPEPEAGGIFCVSCTSKGHQAERYGHVQLDSTSWGTNHDTTYARVHRPHVVPSVTFRTKLATLDADEFAAVRAAAKG